VRAAPHQAPRGTLTGMKRTLNPLAMLIASTALVVLTGASSVSAADTQSVTIDNFAFSPAEATVSVGSTLTWTNQQNARHTTTADDGAWDSGILTSGTSFDFTFAAPGDFAYHCDIHP
jgi:plastocyanin